MSEKDSYLCQITDDLLTKSVTFTWFYKIENNVFNFIKSSQCYSNTSWNIISAILKILLFLRHGYTD